MQAGLRFAQLSFDRGERLLEETPVCRHGGPSQVIGGARVRELERSTPLRPEAFFGR
jgi:hypothetical protein